MRGAEKFADRRRCVSLSGDRIAALLRLVLAFNESLKEATLIESDSLLASGDFDAFLSAQIGWLF